MVHRPLRAMRSDRIVSVDSPLDPSDKTEIDKETPFTFFRPGVVSPLYFSLRAAEEGGSTPTGP